MFRSREHGVQTRVHGGYRHQSPVGVGGAAGQQLPPIRTAGIADALVVNARLSPTKPRTSLPPSAHEARARHGKKKSNSSKQRNDGKRGSAKRPPRLSLLRSHLEQECLAAGDSGIAPAYHASLDPGQGQGPRGRATSPIKALSRPPSMYRGHTARGRASHSETSARGGGRIPNRAGRAGLPFAGRSASANAGPGARRGLFGKGGESGSGSGSGGRSLLQLRAGTANAADKLYAQGLPGEVDLRDSGDSGDQPFLNIALPGLDAASSCAAAVVTRYPRHHLICEMAVMWRHNRGVRSTRCKEGRCCGRWYRCV